MNIYLPLNKSTIEAASKVVQALLSQGVRVPSHDLLEIIPAMAPEIDQLLTMVKDLAEANNRHGERTEQLVAERCRLQDELSKANHTCGVLQNNLVDVRKKLVQAEEEIKRAEKLHEMLVSQTKDDQAELERWRQGSHLYQKDGSSLERHNWFLTSELERKKTIAASAQQDAKRYRAIRGDDTPAARAFDNWADSLIAKGQEQLSPPEDLVGTRKPTAKEIEWGKEVGRDDLCSSSGHGQFDKSAPGIKPTNTSIKEIDNLRTKISYLEKQLREMTGERDLLHARWLSLNRTFKDTLIETLHNEKQDQLNVINALTARVEELQEEAKERDKWIANQDCAIISSHKQIANLELREKNLEEEIKRNTGTIAAQTNRLNRLDAEIIELAKEATERERRIKVILSWGEAIHTGGEPMGKSPGEVIAELRKEIHETRQLCNLFRNNIDLQVTWNNEKNARIEVLENLLRQFQVLAQTAVPV